MRVCDLFESPQKGAGKRGPLEVEAAHQRDDLEVVRKYPDQNSLWLVPDWILEQVAISAQFINCLLKDVDDVDNSC